MKYFVFLITCLLSVGLATHYSYAQIQSNSLLVLEGSGFAVTESQIKTSQIDFAIKTNEIKQGRGSFIIEDGFVTLDDDEFVVENISGTVLRDGKFLRISGSGENNLNNEILIRFFGRLVEQSKEGSVYSLSGRITQDQTSFKTIYTTKISGLTNIIESTTTLPTTSQNIIRIMPGAYDKGLALSYVEGYGISSQTEQTRARYFSTDRITIEPGTTITLVNDDIVSHTIVSGTGLGSSSRASEGKVKICEDSKGQLPKGFSFVKNDCTFTLDGRVNTGEIPPGESVTITFDEIGFYRLIDPNYPWMNIVVYSFPDVDSIIIRQGQNRLGN